ncbi:MAG: DUF4037 domain-containing protein, partial [Clostridia bacterium]|nr:DUF4037 domain-containing protein [Clostridia bacterium]
AYSKLPKEFMGFKRQNLSVVGRRGVISIGEFYKSKTGVADGNLTVKDWFSVPEFYLAEAVNGEIFADDLGQFTEIRKKISKYPDDVFKKKLAGNLLLMKQAGQYNYQRILSHGERASAQLAVVEFSKAAINAIFLLNHRYQPFYKWTFCALKDLPLFGDTATTLEFLLTSENDDRTAPTKRALIEDICGLIADHLIENGVSKATCRDLEKHAYSINDSIEDISVRNMNVLSAV